MAESLVWSTRWIALRPTLERLSDRVREQVPDVGARIDSLRSTEAFPFSACLGFGGSPESYDEEVVVSATVWRGPDEYVFRSDICLADGAYLADGPTGSIGRNVPDPDLDVWIEGCLSDFTGFVDGHVDLIVRTLHRDPNG